MSNVDVPLSHPCGDVRGLSSASHKKFDLFPLIVKLIFVRTSSVNVAEMCT